jgi:hypothetical protein
MFGIAYPSSRCHDHYLVETLRNLSLESQIHDGPFVLRAPSAALHFCMLDSQGSLHLSRMCCFHNRYVAQAILQRGTRWAVLLHGAAHCS